MICEWASRAVENAMTFKEIEKRRILRKETGILKNQYILHRLKQAMKLARARNIRYTAE